MFGKLKERLKNAINKVSQKVEEESIEEPVEEVKEQPKKEKKDEPKEKKTEKPVKEKVGFFKKISQKIILTAITESLFEEVFWELEIALLENNVAFEVIEKIKHDMKKDFINQQFKKSELQNLMLKSLKKSIESLFEFETFDLIKKIKESKQKPYVITFVGINGSGKTTTIAKVAHLLKKNNLNPVLVAGDTWRKSALEQLEVHGKELDVKVIKHDYGSDPAAVAFDGIKYAKSKGLDVVLIDTAGRMHSNKNLMREMEKIIKIASPDLKIFIGESITGNDCVEQSKNFNESINIDCIILSKIDVDDKGGAAISIGYVTKKPILFLGTGQSYDDLIPFDKEKIMKSLGI